VVVVEGVAVDVGEAGHVRRKTVKCVAIVPQ